MDQCTFQFQTQIHQEPILRTNFNRKIYAMLDLSILIGSLKISTNESTQNHKFSLKIYAMLDLSILIGSFKIFNQWEHSKPP